MSLGTFWSRPAHEGDGPFTVQAASMAALSAAQNLFHKAVDALARGDEDRARRVARQAADRPFDDFEGVWPGPWAAHYALFELVTDVIEEWPEDDDGWVDALADLISAASGRHLEELRHLAAVLQQDAARLTVGDLEARRLGALSGGADPASQPDADLPEDERPGYVLDLARLVLVTQARLDDAVEQVEL